MLSDEILWQNYLQGDESGLIKLMEEYGNSLTFYISAYLNNINDAEDLMIEAFAYLTVKKPNINKNFKAYLYKTARHLALRFLAKKRKNPCFCFEDLGQEPESKLLVEELVQNQERNRVLEECMQQINPSYREALYLVYFENMRQAEAAAVMNKSEKQVADLIYRGKISLRRRLEEEGITSAEY